MFDIVSQFQLSAADYAATEVHGAGAGASITVFAPAVFATLRTAFGLGRAEFLASVAPASPTPYLRYISNSSGKHNFYFSSDKRFIFKTETKETIKTFLGMLE